MRHIGKVAFLIERKHPGTNTHRLLFIEAVTRYFKNKFRQMLREKMKELRQPLSVPYAQIIIDYLNLVFIRPQFHYWEITLRTHLVEYFNFTFPACTCSNRLKSNPSEYIDLSKLSDPSACPLCACPL